MIVVMKKDDQSETTVIFSIFSELILLWKLCATIMQSESRRDGITEEVALF
jgi:hypothetical protein